jgi:hypothetical protein
MAMTTAPRAVRTVDQSLASLRAAGFTQVVQVYSDTPHDTLDDPAVDVHQNDPPLGDLRNWCHALEQLLTVESDWLLLLEDDITWASGAAAALGADLERLTTRRASIGYLSLYCAQKISRQWDHGRKLVKPGFYATSEGWRCWGSQAYVVPRSSALALRQSVQFQQFQQTHTNQRDSIVSECFKALKLDRLYRLPCLVNHELGASNSARHGGSTPIGLETRYWTGHA